MRLFGSVSAGPSARNRLHHGIVQLSAEAGHGILGRVGMRPVGEEHHAHLLFQIDPERSAGEAGMPDAAGRKISAAGAFRRGRIPTHRAAGYFRVIAASHKIDGGFPQQAPVSVTAVP